MHLVLHFGRLQLPIGSCLKLRDNENLYRTVGFYKGKLSADMQQVQEFISGIDAVEAGSAMLPVVSPEAGPKYSVNLHAWAYYAMAHGGWSPYLHAETTHNPVIYRVIPWAPGEEAGLRGGDLALRRIAACYDYVLVWNAKPGDAALLRPFFSVVRATTHLHIWRNRLGARKGTPSSNPACASEQRAATRSSTP